jgi:hypothetical protein
MIKDSNFYALGKKLGVSDNAIRKRLKRIGVISIDKLIDNDITKLF